jgi:hypothetical protein
MPHRLWIALYFLSFYILVVFIMCNLLIALIVECYDANLSLNLENFSLASSADGDEDAPKEQDPDEQIFLEYDRQLMILARIANFDKDSHRCCSERAAAAAAAAAASATTPPPTASTTTKIITQSQESKHTASTTERRFQAHTDQERHAGA